jgi:Peptidase family M28
MIADPARLRATVERLAPIDRLPASEGERAAAEWIRGELAALGLDARLEEAPAHGTYWIPLGLLSAAAGAAGALGHRATATAVGALAALGVIDDVSGGPQRFRRLLPRRTTVNVVAEAGDPDGATTVVVSAHHDATRGGLIFHPGPSRWVAHRFPDWYAKQETSPQVMRLVAAGPALVALGAATGVRALRRTGTAMALLTTAVLSDIATRSPVPGANDNLSSVAAVLELARLLRHEPPRGVRVLLLSTGSEESFMEGMRGFLARHAAELPRERTRFVVLESLGSPELILLEGEGMIRMRDYTPALKELLARAGDDAGHALRRRLRTGLATDALLPLLAGYDTACIASCDEYKMASNYHSQRDTPDRVDYGTVARAVDVCAAAIRRLSAVPSAAPARA